MEAPVLSTVGWAGSPEGGCRGIGHAVAAQGDGCLGGLGGGPLLVAWVERMGTRTPPCPEERGGNRVRLLSAVQRFNAEQMLKIVVEEHMSKEREKAINQVAESVTELADIFKEIQVLVIDQVRRDAIHPRDTSMPGGAGPSRPEGMHWTHAPSTCAARTSSPATAARFAHSPTSALAFWLSRTVAPLERLGRSPSPVLPAAGRTVP